MSTLTRSYCTLKVLTVSHFPTFSSGDLLSVVGKCTEGGKREEGEGAHTFWPI